MSRLATVLLLTIIASALVFGAAQVPSVRASDCRRTSVDLTPITALEPERYQGYRAGMYPDGKNTPPAEHTAVALERSALIQPRRTDGSVAPDGKIVLLSIGMTNATQEYQAFMDLAAADPQVSPDVLLVDGAQPGEFAGDINTPGAAYWGVVNQRLQAAGASAEQVQAIWVKQVPNNPTGPFPEHAQALKEQLKQIVLIARDRYPNLQIVYLSSRIYGGYATARTNPEPYAYESAFSVKWLIEDQIGGDATLNPDPDKGDVKAPVLLWGPYMWADGLTVRHDGLTWQCSDFENDGTRPSSTGEQKVASMLLAFFKIDGSAKIWFMADPDATPLPTATMLPTETPGPTNTPGGGRPTRDRPTREPFTPGPGPNPTGGPTPTRGPTATPAPMKSYRVTEVPTNDQMWVSTNSAVVQRQLERIDPAQPIWVCGLVETNAEWEWGFRFEPSSVAVTRNVPDRLRSTIRDISSSPATGPLRMQCIRVGSVTEVIDGTPTPGASPGPGTPVATKSPTTRPPPVGWKVYAPILVNF